MELTIHHLVNAGQSDKAGAHFPGRFFVEDVGSRTPAFQSIYYVLIFRRWTMFRYKEMRFKGAKGIKVSNSWGVWENALQTQKNGVWIPSTGPSQ